MDWLTWLASQWWVWLAFCLLLGGVASQTLRPNPLRILDHVNYLSGTLGTGKTGFAALLAEQAKRRGFEVYATFVLEGAKPLEVSLLEWPMGAKSLIIIDEVLLLMAERMLDWGAFTSGLALARQRGQKVIILSQAHRCEPLQKKGGWGTIGMFLQVRGVSFGKLGRLIWIRRAAEPFRRSPKGYTADKVWRSFHWLPPRVFSSYNSRMIYGYTCGLDGAELDHRAMVERAEARRLERQPKRFRGSPEARSAIGQPQVSGV